MSDVVYDFSNVGKGYGDQAIWNAIYFKLAFPNENLDPSRMLNGVHVRWKARASILKQAGYAPLQGVNVQYARNCPPLGVKTRSAKPYRTCNQGKICPFCWGRRVVLKCWNKINGAAFVGPQHQHSRAEIDIFEAYYRETFDDVNEAVKSLMQNRTRETRMVKAEGTATVISVYPAEGGGYVACRRNLMIIPRGSAPELKLPGITDCGVRGLVDRPLLSKMVGYLCRYPREFMQGNVEEVIKVLAAMNHVRQCSFSGSLYSEKKSRK